MALVPCPADNAGAFSVSLSPQGVLHVFVCSPLFFVFSSLLEEREGVRECVCVCEGGVLDRERK